MAYFIDFIQDLFSPSGFPARWVCGQWTPFHGWLYILSRLAIWLAYSVIPLFIFLFVRKKKEALPFSNTFWLFIVFIFACGLTHLSDSIMFWFPAYRVSALLLFFTAIISWVAVINLFKILPQLFSLKTPTQVEYIIKNRYESLLEELKKSEERWQFALEGSQLGVWDWNLETNQAFFSTQWKALLGYENEEINPDFNEWKRRIHPDDKENALVQLESYISGQIPAFKIAHRLQGKDNTYRWAVMSGMVASRPPDGKALRLVGTLEDIHAAKEAQEKLRISENTFFNAFQFSGIGMAFVSPEGSWQDVNPAICQLLGYTKEELLQTTFQEITHPEDLETDLENVGKMLRQEISSYQMEKRYVHKDGSIIWAILTVSLVWETAIKPKFFISQVVDISATKNLIEALEQNNQKINITALDLEGKIKQLEEFNKIVSHNLRGPAGNIQMLLSMIPADLPEIKDNAYYTMLLQSSEKLTDTLNDLMKVLEVRMNRDIKFDECPVEELIQRVLASFRAQIVEKQATMELDLSVEVIQYPKIYLESILYNLISNALKYSSPDKAPIIQIKTFTEKDRIILTVKDNGLGIDLAKYGNQIFKLKKIFHAGFDSNGVGLFMTKNQIETFGGRIEVQSAPQQGSEFKITF